MTKVLIILCAVMLAFCVIFFMAWRNASNERKELKARTKELEGTLNSVLGRLSAMEQAAKVTAENGRKANEKIDAMRSGDACRNALDVLSKRENLR